jgi:hypothetical protein
MISEGAHGGAVGSRTAIQAGSIPDGVVGIFHWRNPPAALWPWG